jgi:tetratricopeptide (TPR) repeat protein
MEESLVKRREQGLPAGMAEVLGGGLGELARRQGDYEAARALFEQALAIFREVQDTRMSAMMLFSLGLVAWSEGDWRRAEALYLESLPLAREGGAKPLLANVLFHLARTALIRGDYAAGRALCEEGLVLEREMGRGRGMAGSLNCLGDVARFQGDYAGARTYYEECLALCRAMGAKPNSQRSRPETFAMRGIAVSLHSLGHVALHQGDSRRAETLFAEASPWNGTRASAAYRRVPRRIGRSCGSRQRSGRAARLFGAAQAPLSASDDRLDLVDPGEDDRNLAAVRTKWTRKRLRQRGRKGKP